MHKFLIGLLLVVALGSGCRKKAAPASASSAHQPVPVVLATPEQAATASPLTGPAAEAVNRVLQLSVPVSGFPTDLSTLIDGKTITTIPTPPPGKKLAIDQAKMRLILLNQ